MNEVVDRCVQVFQERYGEAPETVVQAPGRVNLIGEHTDYNQGFVFPAAIDRWIAFAARPRSDNQAHLHSVSFDEDLSFTMNRRLEKAGDWGDYARGMVSQFQAANLRIGGFEGVIAGNVPLGAGLSSSAALEMAIGRGLLELFDIQMTGQRLATIGQAAENQFVGVNCGIMDQFISANGRAGHALFLDCRDLSFELVPLATEEVKIVICNSGVSRGLTDSAYNDRRNACEQGVRQLSLATGMALSSAPGGRSRNARGLARSADRGGLSPLSARSRRDRSDTAVLHSARARRSGVIRRVDASVTRESEK